MPSPREFLVFRLWGPMSSWGSIAVGEQRQTWQRPSRSAVLGLVAAALGIERANAAAHLPLEKGLGFAVRVDQAASPLRDYHTAQAPSAEGKRRWRSRHDEIKGAKSLNTILSERSYHAGMNAVVALWRRDGTPEALPVMSQLEHKLRHPTFALFLGRKASPLGMPLYPLVVPAETIAAAYAAFDARDGEHIAEAGKTKRSRLKHVLEATRREPAGAYSVWLDPADIAVAGAHDIARQTQRRDGIRDRRTWTFNDRQEIEVKVRVAS